MVGGRSGRAPPLKKLFQEPFADQPVRRPPAGVPKSPARKHGSPALRPQALAKHSLSPAHLPPPKRSEPTGGHGDQPTRKPVAAKPLHKRPPSQPPMSPSIDEDPKRATPLSALKVPLELPKSDNPLRADVRKYHEEQARLKRVKESDNKLEKRRAAAKASCTPPRSSTARELAEPSRAAR